MTDQVDRIIELEEEAKLPSSYYDPKRCLETVFVKEVYRYTGRRSTGFEMHYTKQQCSRKPQKGRDRCWQHPHQERVL